MSKRRRRLSISGIISNKRRNLGAVTVEAEPAAMAAVQVVPRAKRPISKELRSVSLTVATAAQTANVLYTATSAVTVTGLRWDLSAVQEATTTANGYFHAIIFVLPESVVASTIAFGNAVLYEPAESVIVPLTGSTSATEPFTIQGSTKAMRKLRPGDQLIVAVNTSSANYDIRLSGIIQFFTKF